MSSAKELAEAIADCPEGATCTYCGNPNDFVDDCGWFFIHAEAVRGNVGPGGYTCKACWDGEPGRKHIAFFGLGER